MKKIIIAIIMCLGLVSCNKNVENSHQRIVEESYDGVLNGIYYTKIVDGNIKFKNDKGEGGVFFYTDDLMYKGYHNICSSFVYMNNELIDVNDVVIDSFASAEFITGITSDNNGLDLKIGDIYRVYINK